MPLSDTVPIAYGHVYSPGDYLDAWIEVAALTTGHPIESRH